MILVIDNYDSFVHNLARYVRLAGGQTKVIRSDVASIGLCEQLRPSGIVISPGPKRPTDAGHSLALVRHFSGRVPILGVCLGHQCIVEAFGGETVRAPAPVHGQQDEIRHNAEGVFRDALTPMLVGRYHSLIGQMEENDARNSVLKKTAWSLSGTLMAVAHKNHDTYGVQFHPESLLTPDGLLIVKNFVRICAGGE